ncbi:allophanate hydrolase [Rhodoferax koreense]|uniref:Allophanate hydrolase n=1 Tax=Rhodoferax koreensis TaxID=1842727 RepID=A0A1P8JUI2_9BURK|nr:5-oxoprolinase subunit PxpB [Rhodoferax koreense]APW37426.1 allophanate hydrolase [Rhodoferax koreense]
MNDGTPHLTLLGTTALLFEAPGALDLAPQQRIWAMAQALQSLPEVREAVPGMNNLMLTFARPPRDLPALKVFEARVLQAWSDTQPLPLQGRVVELPVVYGGAGGPHLADVVAHTGLSIDAVVELHAAPLYPVYALGSHPGYCYLGGMDARIATPRRAVPIVNLPGGSVSIGGVQTGVSASAGPSGWNTIGSTTMDFFNPAADPPAVLQPGDCVRFRVQDIIR